LERYKIHAQETKTAIKLSAGDVSRMKLLHNSAAMTFTILGRLFGVSTETASTAVQGLDAYRSNHA